MTYAKRANNHLHLAEQIQEGILEHPEFTRRERILIQLGYRIVCAIMYAILSISATIIARED